MLCPHKQDEDEMGIDILFMGYISWWIHGVLWFNGFPRYRTVDPGVVSTLAAQVRTLASLAWAKCPCICFRRSSTYPVLQTTVARESGEGLRYLVDSD